MFLNKNVRYALVAATCLALILAWAQSRAQGGDLRYGQTVEGNLSQGKADAWLFAGSAQDMIAISTISISAESAGEARVIRLLAPDAQPIAATQAVGGSARLEARLPQAGIYTIEVSGAAGRYRLTLGLIASAAQTPTPTPITARETVAGPIEPGKTVQGSITNEIFRQFWRFSANAGSVVDIRMTALSGDLDPFLSLVAPTGDVVATNGSISSPTSGSASGLDAGILAFQLPFSGEYTIVARRDGPNAGRDGSTRGQYALTLNLRGPNTAQNSVLAADVTLYGRLTANIPLAVYRLEGGRLLALRLDLGGADRLARIRVLTTAGAVLETYQGLSPLMIATRPPAEPRLLEISAPGFGDDPIDFSVAAYRLADEFPRLLPLFYGRARQSTLEAAPQQQGRPPAPGAEAWYFVGQRGDLARLEVRPDVAALDTVVRVIGPGSAPLYQGTLGPGLAQFLALPADGLYLIEMRLPPGAASAGVAYLIRLDRVGANATPFDRFRLARDLGMLPLAEPTQGTLERGAADARWLDAVAGQIVQISAAPQASANVIGLGLQRPDGSFAEVQFSKRERGAIIQRARIEQTGRYRVVIFDAGASEGRGARQNRYTLRYRELSGGTLRAGQRVKGLLTRGLSLWSIDVDAGALINARLTPLTSWSPNLHIVEPGGRVIAAADGGESGAALFGVPAPVSGQYELVVSGQVGSAAASFELLTDVRIPFTGAAGQAVRVNATRLPIERYTQPAPTGPVRINIADLVNPIVAPTRAEAQPLSFDTTVRGEIPRGALAQTWRFSVGSQVTIQIRATSLSGSTGPGLTLWDRAGRLIYEQFQADGPTTLLTYRVAQGGQYDVVVNLGLNGGRYTLTLQSQQLSDGVLNVADGTPLLYGQTAYGEVLGGDGPDSYYFIGAVNDAVIVQLQRATGRLWLSLQLIAPGGRVVAEAAASADEPSVTLDAVRLPENGVYTLRVGNLNQQERADGRYSLYLGLSDEVRLRNRGGGIITRGAAQIGLLGPENTEDTWLFRGRQGERVTFTAASIGSPAPAPLNLQLLDTTGQPFATQQVLLGQDVVRLSEVILPAGGVYRVRVAGGSASPGIYRLAWEPERDRLVVGPLQYGQTVGGLFTPERRFDTWVFSGTTGDVVSVALRYMRGQRFAASFQLRSENGVPLATVVDVGDGQGARADVVLPFSGSYSVVVANPDPAFQGAGVYSLSVNLQDSKARSAGGILRYGEHGQGDIYVDDVTDTWVFAARAGDRVRIRVQARDRFLKPVLELHTATGEVLAAAQPENGEARIGGDEATDYVIQADGTYAIVISGGPSEGTQSVSSTGSYEVALDFTPPPVAEVEKIAYGSARNGLIADDRPAEFYVFDGKQGDMITANIVRESGSNLSAIIELRAADGTILARADSNDGESAVISQFRLPRTEQYRLAAARFLGAAGQTFGRYVVRLDGVREVREVRGTVRYGQEAIGRLNDDTPVDRLSFEGRAGDVIGIVARATSGDLDIALALETASGETIAANDDFGEFAGRSRTDAAITGLPLPADGVYTLVISRVGASAGNYELLVNRLYQLGTAVPRSLIAYGARVVGAVDAVNAEVRYGFAGNRGDEIGVQLLHQTDEAPPLLTIQDPAGTTLAEGQLGVGQTNITRYRLPASGTYILVVRRPANAQTRFSPFALTLNLLGAAPSGPGTSGGVLRLNDAVTGVFVPGEDAHYWLFEGKSGQNVVFSLLWLNGDLLPSALILGPNGLALRAVAVSARAATAFTEPLTLPADGVYSVLVLPGGANRIGQYRLVLQLDSSPPPEAATITPGLAVSGIIEPLGQSGQRFAFSGARDQTVSARMLVIAGTLEPRLSLLSADGRILAEGALQRNARDTSSVISGFPLPDSGTYFLQPRAADGAGTYRLLLEVGSPAAPLTAEAVAARLTAYNQPIRGVIQGGSTALWAFVGAAGDVVSLTALANAPGSGSAAIASNIPAPALEVRDVSGRMLAAADPVGPETNIHELILPEAGRFIAALRAPETTSYTLVVQRREPPTLNALPQPRILVAGTPLQNSISPGDIADYWTYNGRAGEVIQIEGTRINGTLRLDMALYGPSGYIAGVTASTGSTTAALGPLRLAEDATYVLVVSRWLSGAGDSVGSYRVLLTRPEGVSGSQGGFIPVYGRPVTGAIVEGDLQDVWTFAGRAGEVVDIRMARLDGNLRPTITVNAPDGNTIASKIAEPNFTEAVISRLTLPVTGSYTIVTGQADATRGDYRVAVTRVSTAAQASVARAEGIAYGEQKRGELSDAQPAQAWVIFGRAGERITVEAAPAPESALDPYLYLLAPDGSTLATDDNSGGGLQARIAGVTLPADGFYAAVVMASPLQAEGTPGRSGTFTISVGRGQPGAAYQGQVRVGDEASGSLGVDEPVQEWTFEIAPGTESGTSGTIAVSLRSDSVTFNAVLMLVAQDGRLLAISAPTQNGIAAVETALPGPGRYAALVSANAEGAQGAYRLRVSYALAPTGGGRLVQSRRAYGIVTQADFSDAWRLRVDAPGEIRLSAARLSGDLDLELSVFAPDGRQVVSVASSVDYARARTLELPVFFPVPGEYTVLVSRLGGPVGRTVGSYTLLAGQPGVGLLADEE